MISTVGQIPQPHSVEAQLTQAGKSETTWKTHAYVVLGYLLIGIGIAFVAASVYMSTVLHPLLAFAVPAPFIGAGSLMLSKSPDSPLVPSFITGSAPLFEGIRNEGGNDCWINSTMQLLLHTPAFADRLKAAESSWRFTPHPLQPLFSAMNQYNRGEAPSSGQLRRWLEQTGVTSADASQQDDPAYFLQHVFKNMGYQLPTMYEKNVYTKNGVVESKTEGHTSSANPLRFFNLAHCRDPKNPSLEAAFERYFHNIEVSPTGMVQTTMNFFKRPPQDFLVSMGQAAEGGVKVADATDCPLDLTLDVSKIGKKTRYSCDGFVYHSGRSALAGHWEAVIKKEGKWWNASDSHVREISEADALHKMRTASFIHYAIT